MKTQILIIMFLLPLVLHAQDAKQIIKQYENEMDANDQEATLTMQLISKNGNVRERTLTWRSQTDKNGKESSYLYFSAPADIKGTAFLTVENESGQDDQWLYLPALKRSRRISSNEKSKSFMGSDFTYEDIGNENSDECNYTQIRTETLNDDQVSVIEATYKDPKRSKETGYSKRIIYINLKNNMLIKSEFYSLDGKLFKVLECSDFELLAESKKWRPNTFSMKNLDKNTQTILKFSNYKINKGIDPNIFTIRHLESN